MRDKADPGLQSESESQNGCKFKKQVANLLLLQQIIFHLPFTQWNNFASGKIMTCVTSHISRGESFIIFLEFVS